MTAPPSVPCLSVVMPVYNEEKTLGTIIEAVLKQPLVAELICVDDCSLDGAVNVLEHYAALDTRLRILRH
ncbi:MAG TPA: glycosyltransferase family 2 protein, partial [Terrimicrobiaceae bacterium]